MDYINLMFNRWQSNRARQDGRKGQERGCVCFFVREMGTKPSHFHMHPVLVSRKSYMREGGDTMTRIGSEDVHCVQRREWKIAPSGFKNVSGLSWYSQFGASNFQPQIMNNGPMGSSLR